MTNINLTSLVTIVSSVRNNAYVAKYRNTKIVMPEL